MIKTSQKPTAFELRTAQAAASRKYVVEGFKYRQRLRQIQHCADMAKETKPGK